MNCTNCGYLLFNLRQPQCPECGQAFEITDYRFPPGEVAFGCPDCGQEYYGNDQQGLPSPRAFECVSCRRALTLQHLAVIPKSDAVLGSIAGSSPWDRCKELGYWTAWWESWKMIMGSPSRFFRDHGDQTYTGAWFFSMTSMYIGLIPYMIYQTLILWGVSKVATMTPGGPTGAAFPIQMLVITYVVSGVLIPLFAPYLAGAIWAVLIQPALWLLAPNRKSMDHTMRVAMYGMAPYALYLIPICGGAVGGIWTLVAMIIGVREVHRTSGWRASIAVLWPIVILTGIYLAVIAVFVTTSLPKFVPTTPAPTGNP
jgi:hypothetical protein